jgi:putative chitinase
VTQPAPAAIVVTVPAGTTLSVGDTGPAVRTLQRALRRVGHDPGAADGVFGQGTAAAVTAFQRESGLATDGVVGPETAHALVQAQQSGG